MKIHNLFTTIFISLSFISINDLNFDKISNNDDKNLLANKTSNSDISLNEIDIYKTLNINDTFSGMISYKNKERFFEFKSNKSCLAELSVDSNYVYNKKVGVEVYRLLYNDNTLKLIMNYNSTLDNFPQIYIYKNETYVYKIYTYDDGGTGGVEYTFSGSFKEITDYNYYYKDFNTNYTFGIKYSLNETYLNKNTKDKILESKEITPMEKVEETNTFPNNLISQTVSTFYNENNIYYNGFGSGTIINTNLFLSCAHNYVYNSTDSTNSETRHFVDSLTICQGRNGDSYISKINIDKVFVHKNYFIYTKIKGKNDSIHDNYDLSIATLNSGLESYNFYNISTTYDSNMNLNKYKNLMVYGYFANKTNFQYKSIINNLKRQNDYKYMYTGDLGGGFSGAPLIYEKVGNLYYIIGIHTSSSVNTNDRYSTMITYSFWNFISYVRMNLL